MTKTSQTNRNYGVLTMGLAAALLVATGRPDAETAQGLVDAGIPQSVVTPALYIIPVIGIVVAILLGRWIGRGRSSNVRWALYAGLGMLAGMLLGLCLELFHGVPGLLTPVVGTLSEPTLLDVFLWILTAFCLFIGLMIGVIALFGQPAMTALAVEEVTDPECLEVRRAERALFGWSAFGMVTLGVSSGALAIARQAVETERLLPVGVALAAGALSALANWVLWRAFDEMQRRHVVEGYAASAIVATLGAFIWAALEALGVAPAIDAVGVLLTLLAVQIFATSYVTSAAMGQTTMFGKPA